MVNRRDQYKKLNKQGKKSMATSINRPVVSGVFRNHLVSIAVFRKLLRGAK